MAKLKLYRTAVIEEEIDVDFPVFRVEEDEETFTTSHLKITEKYLYEIKLRPNGVNLNTSKNLLYNTSNLQWGEESSQANFEAALTVAQEILNQVKNESMLSGIVIGHQIINDMEGRKEYKCTDCQTVQLLPDNGAIIVGICSKCKHPLWNAEATHP